MEGKGLIKFFAVLMFFVCAYQFLLMIPTNRVDSKAKTYAKQHVDSDSKTYSTDLDLRRQHYLDSTADKTILNIPLVKKFKYNELLKQQIGLGLDLKGGMSVVMQVDLSDMIVVLANKSKDKDLLAALKTAKRTTDDQGDYVARFVRAYEAAVPGQNMSTLFATGPLQEEINFETTNSQLAELIRAEGKETVKMTYERLKQRIDKFGVTQPNVSLDENTDRIIVELPGVKNPQRTRDLLQASAALEFWYVQQSQNVIPRFREANQYLKGREAASGSTDTTTNDTQIDPTNPVDSNTVETNLEDNLVDQGPLLSLITLNLGGGSSVGSVERSDTAQFNDYLEDQKVFGLLSRGLDVKYLWEAKPDKDITTGKETTRHTLHAINTEGRTDAFIGGDKVATASPQTDNSGNVIVSLTFKPEGARLWGEMTERCYPQRQQIAIVLDNQVASAPAVQAVMRDGRSQITGGFTPQEAQDLSTVLKIGKLPAKTEIISESIVGPTLGKKNIRSSLISLLVGFGIVFLFMILYYGKGGIISVITLFANLFFILAALASLGSVLTLPGIAGIILTIGMAVDANVIIYERIREELRAGKAMAAAIRDGFKYSYSAIIDANVTTILTALVLFYFGLGPIKGFATILIIGVICSLFSAVLLGRLLIDWWTSKGREINFSTGATENAFANLNIDFVGKRKTTYLISGFIILFGIGSMFLNKFELGVDFKGGYSYVVDFDQPVSTGEVKDALTASFKGLEPVVKTFGTSNQVEVTTTYLIDGKEEGAEELVENPDSLVKSALYDGLSTFCAGKGIAIADRENFEQDNKGATFISRSMKVGPTIAKDIKRSSILATIFALLFIFLYILLRFRKWQFGLGAVAALFHDVLILLGIFSIFHRILPFSLEINQAFIAALLTVVGYSINDTVVVFDRVREFLDTYAKRSKKDIFNLAINNTISRTIITSLTTLFVVLILFIFGGTSIRGFAFALLIGIFVGTYSSVFVATPLVYDLTGENIAKELEQEAAEKEKANKRTSTTK